MRAVNPHYFPPQLSAHFWRQPVCASRLARAAALLIATMTWTLTVLAAGAPATPATPATPAKAVPDTLAQRLQACAPCHGREGKASASGYQPRIAGKPPQYLYNQLINFREGRRSNAAMTALIDNLSEPYLREIANHYGALDLPYPPPQTRDAAPAQSTRGRQLVFDGDPAQALPACVRCHGQAMTGFRPAVPGLRGLPRDYISAQLGAWQTGLRRAAAPDCMAQIARKLSPADVTALATWLSSQALPADTHAVSALPEPMPLSCGEQGR
jgi:cytochrome c553